MITNLKMGQKESGKFLYDRAVALCNGKGPYCQILALYLNLPDFQYAITILYNLPLAKASYPITQG